MLENPHRIFRMAVSFTRPMRNFGHAGFSTPAPPFDPRNDPEPTDASDFPRAFPPSSHTLPPNLPVYDNPPQHGLNYGIRIKTRYDLTRFERVRLMKIKRNIGRLTIVCRGGEKALSFAGRKF